MGVMVSRGGWAQAAVMTCRPSSNEAEEAPVANEEHLRILKEANLVETERRGRWTVYRPCPERVALLAEALRAVGTTRQLPGGPTLSAA